MVLKSGSANGSIPKIKVKRIQTITPKTQCKKTLKVITKLSAALNEEIASPCSDFPLEHDGNIKHFFKQTMPEAFAPYNPPVNSIYSTPSKFSVVGAPYFVGKPRPSTQSSSGWHAISQRKKSLKEPEKPANHDQTFNKRLQMIEDGKQKEALSEEVALRSMRIGPKLSYTKQNRVLDSYSKTTQKWGTIEKHLSKKTIRKVEDLAITKSTEFRYKVEGLERNEFRANEELKTWPYIWYMTLRDNSDEKLRAYVPVGNPQIGVFGLMTERRPRFWANRNSFVKRTESAVGTRTTFTPRSTLDFWVKGSSKFPLELESARKVGMNYLTAEYAENQEKPEVLERHYDPKVLY